MFGTKEDWIGSIVANLIGGLIFFWVDRWIFRKTNILRGEVWEIQQDIACADCGTIVDRGYRLAKSSNYDHTNDKKPEFRCKNCSRNKYERDWGKPASEANLPIDEKQER
jgi:DNA-directed RNA polymerase subunit RPC12/RpoP